MSISQSYQLRDYQQRLIDDVISAWGEGKRRAMLQLPTGAGKTVLFSNLAKEFTVRGEGVLVLAHREELIVQAHEKLQAVTGVPAGIIKAGTPVNPLFPIQVASIQTIIRRKNLPQASLVICDEAHHSCSQSYTKIFNEYSNSYILGVTATPARIDGQGFKYLYDALILGASVAELIKAGYLCKFRLFAAAQTIKTNGVKTTGGEFNQRALAEAVDSSLVMGDLIKTWRKHADGKKTVVFAVDVTHSKKIAEAYQEDNIPAEHLDGETPADERKAILERFRTGQTLVLTNCGIVSEGFDLPSIEAIQCVRPTRSLILWLQMIGRVLRPAAGKDHAIIIDHTQNWLCHGLPDDDREWSLEPVSLDSRRWSLECPECNHIFKPLPHEEKPFSFAWNPKKGVMIPIMRATCPNCQSVMEFERGEVGEGFCPHIVNQDESAEIEEVELEGDPVVIAELLFLKEQQVRHGYRPMWIYHRLIDQFPDIGLAELRECAKLLGYKSGWAWHKWQELQQKSAVASRF